MHPVVGLGQRRELVAREARERRPRRLHHDRSAMPASTVTPSRVAATTAVRVDDRSREEGVRRVADRAPGELLDRHRRPLDLRVAQEMASERRPERLDRARQVLARRARRPCSSSCRWRRRASCRPRRRSSRSRPRGRSRRSGRGRDGRRRRGSTLDEADRRLAVAVRAEPSVMPRPPPASHGVAAAIAGDRDDVDRGPAGSRRPARPRARPRARARAPPASGRRRRRRSGTRTRAS